MWRDTNDITGLPFGKFDCALFEMHLYADACGI